MTAGLAAATMLFLAPVMGRMPHATLAAVVVAYSIGLVSTKEVKVVKGVRALEFQWAVAACLGVIVLGTLKGILVAVLLSMGSLLALGNRAPVLVLGRKPGTNVFRPLSDEHPEDETFEGLLIVRPQGRLYFANAEPVAEKLQALVEAHQPRVLLFDCGAIPGFEYTALRILVEAERRLRDRGIELWMADLNPEALDLVRRTTLADTLGRERMHFTVELAVEAYLARTAR